VPRLWRGKYLTVQSPTTAALVAVEDFVEWCRARAELALPLQDFDPASENRVAVEEAG